MSRLLGILISVVALLGAGSSRADDATINGRQNDARVHAEQGLRLYGADKWREAYAEFRAAADIFHAPTLVLYMARCQRKLGKLLDARVLYKQVVAEELPENAPAAFLDARREASSELESINALIPSMTIIVTGHQSTIAVVTLDGMALTEPSRVHEVDPGEHVVVVEIDGREAYRRTAQLVEGARETLSVDIPLPPAPASARNAPSRIPIAAASGVESSSAHGSMLPSMAAFGVGAAAVATGGILGGLALARSADIKRQCVGNLCPISSKESADTAIILANVSTGCLILGGIAAGAGVVLFVVRPGRPVSSTPVAPMQPRQRSSLSVRVGLGAMDVRGAF